MMRDGDTTGRCLRRLIGKSGPTTIALVGLLSHDRAALAVPAAPRRGAARALASDRGQSTVEMLGLLPLLVAVTLGAVQTLAAGASRSAASAAAEAAAMAILQGGDPTRAARAAAPSWATSRMSITVTGRHVHVRITPRSVLPGLSGLLTTTADATA
jgi:Flp pilus assembly protein TadG